MASEDGIDAAWTELEAHWEEEERHERFLALADATDRLPDVAKRYRAVKDSDPVRAEIAGRWLEQLTKRALSRMASAKRDETPKRSRLEWIALGVSVALATAALWQMLRVM